MSVGFLVLWEGGTQTGKLPFGLAKLYKSNQKSLNTSFLQKAAGQTGPLVRRLECYGKIEGQLVEPWEEYSYNLHITVKLKEGSKVAARGKGERSL